MDGRELEQQVERDAIDTVLVVFPDLQGRLVGKRVTGSGVMSTSTAIR